MSASQVDLAYPANTTKTTVPCPASQSQDPVLDPQAPRRTWEAGAALNLNTDIYPAHNAAHSPSLTLRAPIIAPFANQEDFRSLENEDSGPKQPFHSRYRIRQSLTADYHDTTNSSTEPTIESTWPTMHSDTTEHKKKQKEEEEEENDDHTPAKNHITVLPLPTSEDSESSISPDAPVAVKHTETGKHHQKEETHSDDSSDKPEEEESDVVLSYSDSDEEEEYEYYPLSVASSDQEEEDMETYNKITFQEPQLFPVSPVAYVDLGKSPTLSEESSYDPFSMDWSSEHDFKIDFPAYSDDEEDETEKPTLWNRLKDLASNPPKTPSWTPIALPPALVPASEEEEVPLAELILSSLRPPVKTFLPPDPVPTVPAYYLPGYRPNIPQWPAVMAELMVRSVQKSLQIDPSLSRR